MLRNRLRALKTAARRRLKPDVGRPVLGDSPQGGPENARATIAVICGEWFDVNVPNAASTFRLGLCRGFAQIGLGYRLVSVFDIVKILPRLCNPIVFVSIFEYKYMSRKSLKVLSRYPHFVWVTPNAGTMQQVYANHAVTQQEMPRRVIERVLATNPRFVCAPAPPSCLKVYDEWNKRGCNVVSLPQACDTNRYFPEPGNTKYDNVKMTFVGGYWPQKAIQFDKYLKGYEDILTVFGYSQWPYKGYRGLIPENEERVLYHNARVCPTISELDAPVTGDIVERVYKIMGSGGLAVTDVVSSYSDLFSKDELLYPDSLDEYHDMINQALTDDDLNRRYRKKGYEAIMKRHTYAHRARQIIQELGMNDCLDSQQGAQDRP